MAVKVSGTAAPISTYCKLHFEAKITVVGVEEGENNYIVLSK